MNLHSAILYSHNIEVVIPFYRDTLGFQLEYQTERFVSFIFPNGAKLGIKNQTEEREKPGYQTVFIAIVNIQNWYESVKNKGIKLYKDIDKKPWGTEFSILDPDGNKVLFVEK
jgi:predicted enzyme related to lactoylglutathione lyase